MRICSYTKAARRRLRQRAHYSEKRKGKDDGCDGADDDVASLTRACLTPR